MSCSWLEEYGEQPTPREFVRGVLGIRWFLVAVGLGVLAGLAVVEVLR